MKVLPILQNGNTNFGHINHTKEAMKFIKKEAAVNKHFLKEYKEFKTYENFPEDVNFDVISVRKFPFFKKKSQLQATILNNEFKESSTKIVDTESEFPFEPVAMQIHFYEGKNMDRYLHPERFQ